MMVEDVDIQLMKWDVMFHLEHSTEWAGHEPYYGEGFEMYMSLCSHSMKAMRGASSQVEHPIIEHFRMSCLYPLNCHGYMDTRFSIPP